MRNLGDFASVLFSAGNYRMHLFISSGLGDSARAHARHADAGRTKITPPVATGWIPTWTSLQAHMLPHVPFLGTSAWLRPDFLPVQQKPSNQTVTHQGVWVFGVCERSSSFRTIRQTSAARGFRPKPVRPDHCLQSDACADMHAAQANPCPALPR